VKGGDSELVMSVLKLRVRCGMPVATASINPALCNPGR